MSADGRQQTDRRCVPGLTSTYYYNIRRSPVSPGRSTWRDPPTRGLQIAQIAANWRDRRRIRDRLVTGPRSLERAFRRRGEWTRAISRVRLRRYS